MSANLDLVRSIFAAEVANLLGRSFHERAWE